MNNTTKIGIAMVILAVAALFAGSYIKADEKSESTTVVNRIETSGISMVDIDGVVSTTLVPDGSEYVEFSYDPKEYSNKSSYDNGKLKIRFKNLKRNTNSKLHATVHCKTLNSIKNDGVGSVKSKGTLKNRVLEINGTGVGSMKLDVQTTILDVINEGVGNMTLTGSSDSLHLENTGVGSTDLQEVSTRIADVQNTGVGNVFINVSELMYLKNTGVGSIKYIGDGVIKEIDHSGVGSISRN